MVSPLPVALLTLLAAALRTAAPGPPSPGDDLHAGPALLRPAAAAPAGDPPQATAVVVSPDGPVRSVAEGLRLAASGGTVVVKPGVYREATLVVERPVEIVGEGFPVLDGEGVRQIMTVRSHDVTVRGFVFRNVGTSFVEDRSAIKVEDVRRCLIEGNRLEDAFFGIYLANVADCRIEGNDIRASGGREATTGNGIHLWYSRDVVIRNNRVEGHRDGIYLEFVEDSFVERNRSQGNLRYGLHFMFSDRCRYAGNVFVGNGAGVAVMYTKNVVMHDNLFDHNWGSAAFGLLLKDITDSEVVGNTFRRNTVGVYAEGSNRTRVEANLFEANGWAVKIMANSLDNRIRRNDFVGNTFDVTTNSRRAYSTFSENYWDAYRGYDLDRDGFGDVPHRPVRLFSLVVERNGPALVLLRSLLVSVLDAAEAVIPALTPETLVDERPAMRPWGGGVTDGSATRVSAGGASRGSAVPTPRHP